jgi:hypothetical protein
VLYSTQEAALQTFIKLRVKTFDFRTDDNFSLNTKLSLNMVATDVDGNFDGFGFSRILNICSQSRIIQKSFQQSIRIIPPTLREKLHRLHAKSVWIPPLNLIYNYFATEYCYSKAKRAT